QWQLRILRKGFELAQRHKVVDGQRLVITRNACDQEVTTEQEPGHFSIQIDASLLQMLKDLGVHIALDLARNHAVRKQPDVHRHAGVNRLIVRRQVDEAFIDAGSVRAQVHHSEGKTDLDVEAVKVN